MPSTTRPTRGRGPAPRRNTSFATAADSKRRGLVLALCAALPASQVEVRFARMAVRSSIRIARVWAFCARPSPAGAQVFERSRGPAHRGRSAIGFACGRVAGSRRERARGDRDRICDVPIPAARRTISDVPHLRPRDRTDQRVQSAVSWASRTSWCGTPSVRTTMRDGPLTIDSCWEAATVSFVRARGAGNSSRQR